MARKIEKINKVLENQMKGALGGNHEVDADWGYPVTSITITQENDTTKVMWVFRINTIEDNYELHTYAETKKEDGKIEPAWCSVNNTIVDFVKRVTSELSDQFLIDIKEEKDDNEEADTKQAPKES